VIGQERVPLPTDYPLTAAAIRWLQSAGNKRVRGATPVCKEVTMTQDVTPSESGERFRQTRLFCSSSLQFLVADRDAACQGVSKVLSPMS
jgi:hypothetical protein